MHVLAAAAYLKTRARRRGEKKKQAKLLLTAVVLAKKEEEKSYKSLFLFLQLKTAIGAAVASRTKEKVLEELLTYPAR